VRVLIAYGTTEGQTRKIAEHVAEHLRAQGHTPELFDCARHDAELQIADFDAVVVIASIHEKAHPVYVTRFVQAHLDALQLKPSLFMSVSLSAAFDDSRAEAQTYVDQFLADTGWKPTLTHLVAGALLHSQYDYYEEQIVERFVLKGREVAAGAEGDRELTDWDDLSQTVETFMRSAGEQAQDG
jgi:menaquinone-dependent protoporphyrinogen oxidase